MHAGATLQEVSMVRRWINLVVWSLSTFTGFTLMSPKDSRALQRRLIGRQANQDE